MVENTDHLLPNAKLFQLTVLKYIATMYIENAFSKISSNDIQQMLLYENNVYLLSCSERYQTSTGIGKLRSKSYFTHLRKLLSTSQVIPVCLLVSTLPKLCLNTFKSVLAKELKIGDCKTLNITIVQLAVLAKIFKYVVFQCLWECGVN